MHGHYEGRRRLKNRPALKTMTVTTVTFTATKNNLHTVVSHISNFIIHITNTNAHKLFISEY